MFPPQTKIVHNFPEDNPRRSETFLRSCVDRQQIYKIALHCECFLQLFEIFTLALWISYEGLRQRDNINEFSRSR